MSKTVIEATFGIKQVIIYYNSGSTETGYIKLADESGIIFQYQDRPDERPLFIPLTAIKKIEQVQL